jgi:hypothetical protein
MSQARSGQVANRAWKIALVAAIVTGPLLGALSAAWAVQTFPDVPPGHIFHEEIEWGAANGIINGYTNGNFGPDDNVNRGQAAAFLSHYNDAIHTVTATDDPSPSSAWIRKATCPAGERAIGGWGHNSVSDTYIGDTYVSNVGRSYQIRFETENNTIIDPSFITVTAVCIPAPVANPPSGAESPPPVE